MTKELKKDKHGRVTLYMWEWTVETDPSKKELWGVGLKYTTFTSGFQLELPDDVRESGEWWSMTVPEKDVKHFMEVYCGDSANDEEIQAQ